MSKVCVISSQNYDINRVPHGWPGPDTDAARLENLASELLPIVPSFFSAAATVTSTPRRPLAAASRTSSPGESGADARADPGRARHWPLSHHPEPRARRTAGPGPAPVFKIIFLSQKIVWLWSAAEPPMDNDTMINTLI